MTEKRERKVTPVGEAKWAHVHSPKAPFVDEYGKAKGEPKFQIDVVFSQEDSEWAEWAKNVMEVLRSLPEQIDKKTGNPIPKQTPIKRELDKEDNPTGRYYVTFKTSDKFKPGVFDLYGAKIPETSLIGNGSLVRVNYSENVYQTFGGGVNFYLNAVQVVKLVEYQSTTASGYGFPVDENRPAENDDNDDVPF
jgi:hypothetical protein